MNGVNNYKIQHPVRYPPIPQFLLYFELFLLFHFLGYKEIISRGKVFFLNLLRYAQKFRENP